MVREGKPSPSTSALSKLVLSVQSEFFAALRRTKLLIGDVSDANYSRCGRTDKGVSAIGQVISCTLSPATMP